MLAMPLIIETVDSDIEREMKLPAEFKHIYQKYTLTTFQRFFCAKKTPAATI
jgi:hypothetical protein